METVEEEAAPTESLPSPEELPAGKDALFAVSECAGNKNNLDLDVSEQVVKSCDACSNKSRKKLRRNSGAKKQCGFEPPFLNKEEDKDSAGNMEENLNESYVQLVGPSTDQEMKQNAQKPVALYEKENDLVEEDVEKLVKGGNIESEVNCMSNRTVKTTCVFEDANWLDPKRLNCESKCSHGTDSSLITFPAESHGNEVSGQEMMVEFESNVINMDELTSRDNGLPFADKKYLTAATSTFLHSEKEWGTELPGGENTNFTRNNVAAAYSRTPFGEAQIVVELKETNVTAAESVKEEVSELNKSSESTGLKSELENFLKKAEKMIANDVSNREGIPHIESSVEAAENQESSVQSHSTTAETDAQKIFEVMQSSYSDTVAPGTPFGPAPVKDECRVEVANAARSGMSDQERSEDPNPGTESCIHESVLMNEENTGLVKNAEKIRIHEDYFESKSSPSVNRTGVIDDSNLVESRTVGFESSGNKVLSPEIASLAVVFSSASRGGHAGRTSSSIELRKVLEIQEPYENMNLINYNMDDEGIRNPVVEDRIEGKLENANMTIVNSVEEVIFNDILKELGESIVLKKRSEIPLKTSEKMSATMFSNGEGIILAERSVKAEKQEYRTEIDVVAATSGTPNTTEIKCRSSSDTATRGTSVGLAPQSQGSLDDALVEVASNATKVVSSGMTYLAEFYTSVNQKKIAGENSNELKPEKVLNLEESLNTENVNYRVDKTEVKENTGLAREDQSSVYSEDTNVTAAVPVQEVVTWESDKTEVKEDTGLPQGDQSSVYSEDTNITAAEPIQEVVIWESDKIEDKEDTSPVQEDQSSLQLEHTNITAAEPVQETVSRESVKMEVKEDTYQEDPCSLHLEDTNITAAEPVQEVVSWESDKIEVDEDISLAQEDQSSIQSEDTNINAAGAVQEIVFWKSDKMEVKEDTSLTQEGKSLMHLEDTNQTAVEPVQEVVFWDHLNKVCESGGTKESGDYLKKTEETGTSDSSGIGMVQTESSVETDEMSETTGQTTTIAMQWSLSSHDKDFISPLRTQVVSQGYQGTTYRDETDVSSAGCAMPDQLNIEENAKIVENEDTIKSETVLFVSGKNINDQSSEGKSREDGVYHPVSDCIDCQCAIVKKMDISDGNFNDVSGEIEEKLTIEFFDGEVAGLVSPEEKDIWNEKLPNNSFQHAINDMQEKSEAICMDTIDGIPVNILPQHALEQLDNESEISKQAFGNGTQTLPSDERTTPITSESFSMSPLDHALVDREMNASGERVVCHPVIKDFAATMDGNGISMSGETDVVQEDNMVEQIATSPLKAELTDYGGGNVDAELPEPNMSVTDPIFQETDTFGVPSTEYPGEISNVPAAMEAENYGVHDDQGEEVGLEHDCSSSFGVDGLTSTAGLDVDNIPVVFPLESTSNSSYPQSGTKVDDLEIIDSDAAKQFDTAFTIEEARVEDGEKSLVSHQRCLHGEQEDVSSTDDTPCSKLEISIEEEHPQAMDDINGVVGTDISTECKVTREEIDGRQISSGGFNDVTDGSFEDESKIGLEELVGAKADDCDGSMKTDTDRDDIDNSDVNLETEEPNAFHFPETIARESREIESCSKLNIVSSMKPEMVVDCSSDERKHLENPDESNIFTNMDTRLLFGIEDDVKNSDAKADDSNDVALDMTVTKCNSREGDYTSKSDVEDTYLSVRKDGPEDTEETMELRNDFSGLDAAMVDKSPFLNSSETAKVADGEKVAFRTELNFLNVSVKMERSNSVPVKHLISSAMQSKSKPGLIQRTPKRPIFHDMKENEGSTKREQIGYRTTSKNHPTEATAPAYLKLTVSL
ncbi:uncharacterized protein LOC120180443 [Hibiscus syriacus]|uniref:uncharacterized protein LOC120180443 n=1 Tax=Hibiscus syriacus TaxID=106335 RepID=UPI0019212AAD|nr:uncharacterized protein LOC120180443 [Hibiscus syriacus]